MIRVYDSAGKVIETYEHAGEWVLTSKVHGDDVSDGSGGQLSFDHR